MIQVKKEIVYPAVPSRFGDEKWREIISFIRDQGHAPFDHRRGAPYADFEHSIGRERALEFLIGTMESCGLLGVFGCSAGTMGEWKMRLELWDKGGVGNIRVFPGFDPDWEKYYAELSPDYGDLSLRLRAKHTVFAIVGPRAIGKTFWMRRLIGCLGGENFGILKQVKTNTSRPPEERDKNDQTYIFWSRDAFERGLAEGKFLEYDTYHGHLYGSSMNDIYEVLDSGRDGIIAITPLGSQKLFEQRDKVNLSIICLRPESFKLLLDNFRRRGMTDTEDMARSLEEAREFAPPRGVSFQTVWLSGDLKEDETRLLTALNLFSR